jgi:hypothetical protein
VYCLHAFQGILYQVLSRLICWEVISVQRDFLLFLVRFYFHECVVYALKLYFNVRKGDIWWKGRYMAQVLSIAYDIHRTVSWKEVSVATGTNELRAKLSVNQNLFSRLRLVKADSLPRHIVEYRSTWHSSADSRLSSVPIRLRLRRLCLDVGQGWPDLFRKKLLSFFRDIVVINLISNSFLFVSVAVS